MKKKTLEGKHNRNTVFLCLQLGVGGRSFKMNLLTTPSRAEYFTTCPHGMSITGDHLVPGILQVQRQCPTLRVSLLTFPITEPSGPSACVANHFKNHPIRVVKRKYQSCFRVGEIKRLAKCLDLKRSRFRLLPFEMCCGTWHVIHLLTCHTRNIEATFGMPWVLVAWADGFIKQ